MTPAQISDLRCKLQHHRATLARARLLVDVHIDAMQDALAENNLELYERHEKALGAVQADADAAWFAIDDLREEAQRINRALEGSSVHLDQGRLPMGRPLHLRNPLPHERAEVGGAA